VVGGSRGIVIMVLSTPDGVREIEPGVTGSGERRA
jgi:hypothetical protein